MVRSCAAYNCKEKDGKGKNLSFHQFPSDSAARESWITASKRVNFVCTDHCYLCSKHFTADCYESQFGPKRLKKNAVPTIFDFTKNVTTKKGRKKQITLYKPVESKPKLSSKSVKLVPDSTVSANSVQPLIYPGTFIKPAPAPDQNNPLLVFYIPTVAPPTPNVTNMNFLPSYYSPILTTEPIEPFTIINTDNAAKIRKADPWTCKCIGNCMKSYYQSPQKARKKISTQRKLISMLRVENVRLRSRVNDLNHLVQKLKKQNTINL